MKRPEASLAELDGSVLEDHPQNPRFLREDVVAEIANQLIATGQYRRAEVTSSSSAFQVTDQDFRTEDGVDIAYAISHEGRPLVRTPANERDGAIWVLPARHPSSFWYPGLGPAVQ